MTFELTDKDIDLIAKALNLMPHGEVALLFRNLQEQYLAQQPKPAEE